MRNGHIQRAKQPISQCKTVHLALRYGPFGKAKRTVYENQEDKLEPVFKRKRQNRQHREMIKWHEYGLLTFTISTEVLAIKIILTNFAN